MRVLGSSSRSCDRRHLARRIELVGVGIHRIVVVVVQELEMTFEEVVRSAVRIERSLDLIGEMTTMVGAMECIVVGEVLVGSIPVGVEVAGRRLVEVVRELSIVVEELEQVQGRGGGMVEELGLERMCRQEAPVEMRFLHD